MNELGAITKEIVLKNIFCIKIFSLYQATDLLMYL